MSDNDNASRRIYVIEDDPDLRKSLEFLLSSWSITVSSFPKGADFLGAIDALRPAPILLDICMDGIDGLELLGILRERGITWPVIMMSGLGDVPESNSPQTDGATQFVRKPFKMKTLSGLLDQAFADFDRTSG